MVQTSLIELGKYCPNGSINIAGFRKFPEIEGVGNLSLKHYKLIQRLMKINKKALENSDIWEQSLNNFVPDDFGFIQEELIFHIRRSVDDMISLIWILEKHKNDPDKKMDRLLVKDIGNYLYGSEELHTFDNHKDFLILLNDIANSYKHSFVNSDLSVIGLNQPCISTLYMRGKIFDETNFSFYNVSQNDLMIAFDGFFKTFQEYLDNY